jgi:hypothetical protein
MRREKMAAAVYLLFLLFFAFAYVTGNVRLIYTPIEGYVPTSLSDKPLSDGAMQDMVSNIEWLNEFYQNKSIVNFLDHFENLSLDFWRKEGNFTLKDSVLTLNTLMNSGISYFYHNFDANYIGTIELKLRFNGFSPDSYILDVLSVRKTSGCGGGVLYCYNFSGANALSYWDSESSSSFQLMPLDEDWHTIKITFNATGRTINVDGSDKLFIDMGGTFGEMSIGQTANFTGYGGSFDVDYILIKANLSMCLITFFREIGPVVIYLTKEIEIVVFVKDIDSALNFAKSKPYTTIFLVLSTGSYQKFALVHYMQTYSIYAWGN